MIYGYTFVTDCRRAIQGNKFGVVLSYLISPLYAAAILLFSLYYWKGLSTVKIAAIVLAVTLLFAFLSVMVFFSSLRTLSISGFGGRAVFSLLFSLGVGIAFGVLFSMILRLDMMEKIIFIGLSALFPCFFAKIWYIFGKVDESDPRNPAAQGEHLITGAAFLAEVALIVLLVVFIVVPVAKGTGIATLQANCTDAVVQSVFRKLGIAAAVFTGVTALGALLGIIRLKNI